MTGVERKRLLIKITNAIGSSRKYISIMEEPSSILSPEAPGGRLSLRDMIKMKSAGERELRAARLRLNKLESALRKIDDPEFGTCFICEQLIPFARLLSAPETTRCIKCEDEQQ